MPASRVEKYGSSSMVSSRPRFLGLARSTLKRVAIAALAWTVAVVVVTGVVRAGHHFAYCRVMETVQAHCCCPHATPEAAEQSASVEMPCCCEHGEQSSLPPMASSDAPHLLAAPLVAVLPPEDPLRGIWLAVGPPPRVHIHSTRPPPTAAATCVRLSVFLI